MVFVLNKNKKPLNPCHPAKARWLLKSGYAVVHKRQPFTIRLKMLIEEPELKDYILKFDPGAKTTGIAIVENVPENAKVVLLAELAHRADVIKMNLESRRAMRRSRRNRKTRYREKRFSNRKRSAGWLPPSVQSIVDNIESWTIRLCRICPIGSISVETVRFDTQLMDNPDIQGVEYQRGTLWGYEVKEYLLYRYGHKCQYCGGMAGDKILEVEHMTSKRNRGSNRIANLNLACRTCNKDKDSLNLEDWLPVLKKSKSALNKERAKNIEIILQGNQKAQSFRDAAKVNSSRKAVYRALARHTENLEVSSGGRTKFNRTERSLPKEHYYDALCVGIGVPNSFHIRKDMKVLRIKAAGRGNRSRTNLDRFGFPRSYLPRQKYFFGFMTGDFVKATIPSGKYKGVWFGTVACRNSGYFDIKIAQGHRINTNKKYVELIQRADGYNYGVGVLSG